MNSTSLITPRKLSGFMELPTYKQMALDKMIASMREVFNRNGFMPLDTPVLEYSEILLAKSGGELDKEVYNFTKGDTSLCMRYDLTVPLARNVAMNADCLTFPFKRYQVGKVFRGERPQKGRFREFIQCDADIVGLDNLPLTADAECINLIYQCFEALNLNALTQISNRNILFGYIEHLGYSDKSTEILVTLDKIDKIGKNNVIQSLCDIGVSQTNAQKLIDITLLKGNFDDIYNKINNLCDNALFASGVSELQEVIHYLDAYQVPRDHYIVNLGIIRGQNYYTGTIFESILPSHPEFGTVCGGGRYDNLAGYFTEKKLPGVGMSIGFTRLFDLLDQNNMLGTLPLSCVELEIIPLGDTTDECLKLSTYFRQQKIATEVNYDNRSFKAKLKDANRRAIPFVIIVGENEVASKTYTLKNMLSGEQATLSQEDCAKQILHLQKKK